MPMIRPPATTVNSCLASSVAAHTGAALRARRRPCNIVPARNSAPSSTPIRELIVIAAACSALIGAPSVLRQKFAVTPACVIKKLSASSPTQVVPPPAFVRRPTSGAECPSTGR
jgi:hypothetical protein